VKAERLVPTPSKRSRKKSLFVLCMAVGYPGEFELGGRYWRVVAGQPARSAQEAFEIFDLPVGREKHVAYIATTYEPALDVLAARQVSLMS